VRFSAVNDVLIHPNQGELLSADQNGTIKQWVLASNECDLELVKLVFYIYARTTPHLNDLRHLLQMFLCVPLRWRTTAVSWSQGTTRFASGRVRTRVAHMDTTG
jgi:hypothetical protein